MIKTDKIRKPQPAVFYIIDYLWSGFAGLSVAMVVVALWAWGSAVFGEFMLPAPVEVFQKSLDLLKHFQENEIGISLWRSVVGISIALVAGLAAGLVAGSFKTAMDYLGGDGSVLVRFRQSERIVYHHCVGCAADVCECGGRDGECEQAA